MDTTALVILLWVGTVVFETAVLLTVRREGARVRAAIPDMVRAELREVMRTGEMDDAVFSMATRLGERGLGWMVVRTARAATKPGTNGDAKKEAEPRA